MDSTSVCELAAFFSSLTTTVSGSAAEGSNDADRDREEGECEVAQIAQNASVDPASATRIECTSSVLNSGRSGHACAACNTAPTIKTRTQSQLRGFEFRVCVQCSTLDLPLDAKSAGTLTFNQVGREAFLALVQGSSAGTRGAKN